jgi:tetratricopeptide (TPR) repeat protein
LKYIRFLSYSLLITVLFITINSCNYSTHRTVSKTQNNDDEDPEPDYNVTLDDNYQDYVTYIYFGNRSESFGTFFNKFYTALDDYDEAMKDYKASTIASYNRRLDSLNIVPAISSSAKELLTKVIERCSKIIQFNKNTRFLDDAVLLIGKSYYFMGEYPQAERKFSEFLSKLTSSELTDEALLYLGRTKIRLGYTDEGVTILQNLSDNTNDLNLKSLAAFDLGIIALTKNDYKRTIEYIKNSIKYTDDDEKKAEKQYILAKILAIYDPPTAYTEYDKVIDNTSDFDLTFYAKLNYAKSLSYINKYSEAYSILMELRKDYREFPEFKQLVELEIANTLFLQKKYRKATLKSFDIIIEYKNTRVSADAYYYLAKYYEEVEKDYLKALVNYKKVIEEFNNSDYSTISSNRANTLDMYFTLQATINDTTKAIIPSFNAELEEYRNKILLEKGVDLKKEKKGEDEEQIEGKGGGYKSGNEFLKNIFFNIQLDSIKGIKDEDIKEEDQKEEDQIENSNINESNTNTELTVTNDEEKEFNAYLELAELFLYELDQIDSAENYLKIAISISVNPDQESKARYTLGTLYKKENRDEEANEIFKQIISENPGSVYANESRKNLGLQTLELETDSTETLFKEAEQNILTENYEKAITILKDISTKFPESSYLPKTIYTLGWIYEYALYDKDNASSFYKTLKDSYPNSVFIQVINPKLEYWASLEKISSDSTEQIQDSNNVIDEKELEKKNEEEENPEEVLKKKTEEEEGDIIDPDLKKPEEEKGIERIDK